MEKKFTKNMTKNKKNILIATGIFPPQVGGPATYSKLLLDKLPSFGFGVRVINFGSVLSLPKVIRHVVYLLKILWSTPWASIVYAQDPVSVGLPALIASRIFGKPFFLKIVGDYAWEQGAQRSGVTDLLDTFSLEHEKYPFFVRLLKKVELFVANHADSIIVPSEYLKKIVTNWGVSPEKITVIYNAFNEPHVPMSKEELRSKLGFSGPVIVSAGRLVPWKGFDTLITLMPEVLSGVPNTKLFIVGEGPDKAYLSECIQTAKMKDHVVLTGKMVQGDLFEYIKAADLFVLNTSYEGFSHQVLEVLALETPIITTDAGGNVEIIKDNDNGILVHYNDKEVLKNSIISLLGDKEKARALAQAGKQKIQEFGEDRMLSLITKKLSL